MIPENIGADTNARFPPLVVGLIQLTRA